MSASVMYEEENPYGVEREESLPLLPGEDPYHPDPYA